jgi:fatty-acid peroxygenase
MPDIPRDPGVDSSLSLLSEGYSFIPSRCQRLESDVFQVRLLMQDTICMSGEDAARLFYDEQLFQRQHAAPRMLKKTLFGQGGVQGLDDAAHRHRKRLFLSLLTDDAIAELVRLNEANWQTAIETWRHCDRVTLLPEVQAILARTVCEWAGVPLAPEDVQLRRDQLAAMIDGAGGIGARHWRARKARKEAEGWMVELISQVRTGELDIDESRALAVVARYIEPDGHVLDEKVAAVEMLNLLRPTVAVARFVIYAALELLAHPQWRQRLQRDDAALEPFAQEVRRLHAFFHSPPRAYERISNGRATTFQKVRGCCWISTAPTETHGFGSSPSSSAPSASPRGMEGLSTSSLRAEAMRRRGIAARANLWRSGCW